MISIKGDGGYFVGKEQHYLEKYKTHRGRIFKAFGNTKCTTIPKFTKIFKICFSLQKIREKLYAETKMYCPSIQSNPKTTKRIFAKSRK